jgi:uncharacterized protein (TIGR03083 family)
VPGLTTEDHLELLSQQVVGMTAALRAATPATAVPACPGWTVTDLATHVIGVHRWVIDALNGSSPPAFDDAPLEGDLADAYADAAGTLVAKLTELPPEHECWTFDRDNRTTSFWRRRQLHEVTIHRWDAQPYAISDEVGADGVDEVLDFFLPRQVHLGRTTLPQGRLELVGPQRTWTIGEDGPVTRVEGTPGELVLGLWGRTDLIPPLWREANLTP